MAFKYQAASDRVQQLRSGLYAVAAQNGALNPFPIDKRKRKDTPTRHLAVLPKGTEFRVEMREYPGNPDGHFTVDTREITLHCGSLYDPDRVILRRVSASGDASATEWALAYDSTEKDEAERVRRTLALLDSLQPVPGLKDTLLRVKVGAWIDAEDLLQALLDRRLTTLEQLEAIGDQLRDARAAEDEADERNAAAQDLASRERR